MCVNGHRGSSEAGWEEVCLVTGEVPKTIHILLLIFGVNLSDKKHSDFVAGAAICFICFLNGS